MKAICGLLIMLLGVSSGQSRSASTIKFDQLEKLSSQPNDTLYVVNFWATWCAPCVEELTQFEMLRQTNVTKPLKVLLVCMDTKKTLQMKVIPFVRSHKLRSHVVLLDEPDLNTWVDKLVPEWSGALPMTLITNKHKQVRQFIGNDE